MEEALNAASLYDAAIAAIHRAGFEVDERALTREFSETFVPNPTVRAAWRSVNAAPNSDNVHYQLAETLIARDEKISFYRWRHFKSVHKIIGYKPGTGGSAGVGWLQHVTEHRFFPELWELRNDL